jgi:hypothetical protein
VARVRIVVARGNSPTAWSTRRDVRSVLAAAVLLIAATLAFLTIGYLVACVLFVAALVAVISATVRGLFHADRRR